MARMSHARDSDTSPAWDQGKRGLLWDVNVAVDKIIAHFSAARTVVQKAQLGDSRVNPLVGQLVLEDLCPALYALLSDGLNPYQHDIIVGRRPQSPWSLVEASVKTGTAANTLYPVYYQFDQLRQLRNSPDKFNAFIFALLNTKQLEFWISSLLNCQEMLRSRFCRTAFLLVSASRSPALSEELLLLLQPLSVFTFQLDPLFAYHHPPPPQQQGMPILPELLRPATGRQGEAEREGPRVKTQALGVKEGVVPPLGDGLGYTFQQTLGQLRQWGGRVAHALINPHPLHAHTPEDNPGTTQAGPGTRPDWWDHLRQGSQVYLTPSRHSSLFTRGLTPKAMGSECSSVLGQGTSTLGPGTSTLKQGTSVLGPGTSTLEQGTSALGPGTSTLEQGTSALGSGTSTLEQGTSALGPDTSRLTQGYKRQLSNSGGILSELQATDHRGVNANRTNSPSPVPHWSTEEQQDPAVGSAAVSDRLPGDMDGQSELRARRPLWLGRLFGARVPSSYSPSEQAQQEASTLPRARLPSAWLRVNVLRVGELLKGRDSSLRLTAIMAPAPQPAKPAKPARKVRTVCDHIATAEDQLSFQEGDILEVVGCVDEDWIRCCHGNISGLVPIGYTSLI